MTLDRILAGFLSSQNVKLGMYCIYSVAGCSVSYPPLILDLPKSCHVELLVFNYQSNLNPQFYTRLIA